MAVRGAWALLAAPWSVAYMRFFGLDFFAVKRDTGRTSEQEQLHVYMRCSSAAAPCLEQHPTLLARARAM